MSNECDKCRTLDPFNDVLEALEGYDEVSFFEEKENDNQLNANDLVCEYSFISFTVIKLMYQNKLYFKRLFDKKKLIAFIYILG